MPKRPPTHETVHLVLEILRRIPKGRYVSAKDLHEQIAHDTDAAPRDIRTVQRQLQWIADHYPIEVNDKSKPYGYRWSAHSSNKSFFIPALNEKESLLLLLAQKHLGSLLPVSVMKSMHGFFEQAQRTLANMDENAKGKLEQEWLSKVCIIRETQPLLPPTISNGVFEAVARTLYTNTWLKVEYENPQRHCTSARVMPLGLAQQGPNLYLACRFEGHDDDRTLAVHRIRSAIATDMPFKRPKFDLKKYNADGHFSFGKGQRVHLSFDINKDRGQHLLETPLSKDQQVVESRDRLKITATVVDTQRLDWWLNSFGDAISNIRKTPLTATAKSSRSK